MSRTSLSGPLALALLFAVTRLLTLLTEAGELHSGDELYAGAAALEIYAGRGLPLPLMAHVQYCGGPILVAGLAGLFFR